MEKRLDDGRQPSTTRKCRIQVRKGTSSISHTPLPGGTFVITIVCAGHWPRSAGAARTQIAVASRDRARGVGIGDATSSHEARGLDGGVVVRRTLEVEGQRFRSHMGSARRGGVHGGVAPTRCDHVYVLCCCVPDLYVGIPDPRRTYRTVLGGVVCLILHFYATETQRQTADGARMQRAVTYLRNTTEIIPHPRRAHLTHRHQQQHEDPAPC